VNSNSSPQWSIVRLILSGDTCKFFPVSEAPPVPLTSVPHPLVAKETDFTHGKMENREVGKGTSRGDDCDNAVPTKEKEIDYDNDDTAST
jgi:hypothetical protein